MSFQLRHSGPVSPEDFSGTPQVQRAHQPAPHHTRRRDEQLQDDAPAPETERALHDPAGFVSRTETHLRLLTDGLDPEYLALMLQSKWNGIFFTGESPARFNVRDLEIQPAPLKQQRATVEGLRALHQARLEVEFLAGALDRLKNAAIDAHWPLYRVPRLTPGDGAPAAHEAGRVPSERVTDEQHRRAGLNKTRKHPGITLVRGVRQKRLG